MKRKIKKLLLVSLLLVVSCLIFAVIHHLTFLRLRSKGERILLCIKNEEQYTGKEKISEVFNRRVVLDFLRSDNEVIRDNMLFMLRVVPSNDSHINKEVKLLLNDEMPSDTYLTIIDYISDGTVESANFLTKQFINFESKKEIDFLKMCYLLFPMLIDTRHVNFDSLYQYSGEYHVKRTLVDILHYQIFADEKSMDRIGSSFVDYSYKEQVQCVMFCLTFPYPPRFELINLFLESAESQVEDVAVKLKNPNIYRANRERGSKKSRRGSE